MAPPSGDEKLINGSAQDHLEDHCIGELMEAASKKDIRAFRAALDALVMNMFDFGEAKDA